MTQPIRILIADDHPLVRQGLTTVLEQEDDLEVVGQARDGIEAVELAKRLAPDVVLMDLQMPRMDGVAAIKEIKQEAPAIGVIILTTYDTDDYIFQGIEAGARGYLLKDSSPNEVVRAIRTVSRGESLIEPRVASRLLDRLSQNPTAPGHEAGLTPRQVEVLELMATGAVNKEIAGRLLIGESTVKTHIVHILGKLGVHGRTEAVMEAARRGIIRL